ncbi:MAG TPA: hypothetical protein VIV35_06905 [Chitinophagaceae bacterium]
MKQVKRVGVVTALLCATSLLIAAFMILFSSYGCSPNDKSKENATGKMAVASGPAVELKAGMHKLWEDHITWTRNVILCLVDELPGADQAVKRLLQNQVDIGNAIKPYYGEDAGKKLTELLNSHITIAAEVVKAAKAGNTPALDEANKRWYANADEIAEFLSKANPAWPLADMKMMMNNHLKLTTDEAVQRIKKNYDADVVAYDKVHVEILKMSDMLADGIIKQFAEKFNAVADTTATK